MKILIQSIWAIKKRNLFLPKYFKNFRKSESICLISSIFGIRYFEAGLNEDLTEEEKDKIDEIVANFQQLIAECSDDIIERYNRAFDQYFQVWDEKNTNGTTLKSV